MMNSIDRALEAKRWSPAADPVSTIRDLFEENIRTGEWPPGAKLPTERELERQFGISRTRLRRVLVELERDGKITRHVGRGSFVAGAPSPLFQEISRRGSEPNLAKRIQGASPMDIMAIRMMIEPASAEIAAARASSADLARIEECYDQSMAAPDYKAYERWDGLLHLEIVRATKNELLIGIYEAVNSARLQPEWETLKARTLQPKSRGEYSDQHHGIVMALRKRDGVRAGELVREHLQTVNQSLFGP